MYRLPVWLAALLPVLVSRVLPPRDACLRGKCFFSPANMVFTCSQTHTKEKRRKHHKAPPPLPFKKTVAATYSPTPPQGSTISVRRLHDRVRKETGYNPSTKTTTEKTVNNVREHPATCSGQALGLLVPVSSTPYKASTPGLSTPSSTGSLN